MDVLMTERSDHIGVDIAQPVSAADEALARMALTEKWGDRGEYREAVVEAENRISIEWKSVNGRQ
jgi:hypothetical protein